jgi:hypothetical protein
VTGKIIAIGITLCALLLSMAPADDTRAEPGAVPTGHERIEFATTGLCVDLALADHFVPDVAAGPRTMQLAPIDPDRTKYHAIPRPGSSDVDGGLIIEPDPGNDPGSPL